MGSKVLTALLLLSALSYHIRARSHPPSSNFPPLPAEIANFYQAYNFVTSFSTPQERERLRLLTALVPSGQGAGTLPQRLEVIRRFLQQIDDHRLPTESGMVHPRGQIMEALPAELIRIERVQTSGAGVRLLVRAYGLTRKVNLALISTFEQDPARVPPLEKRIEMDRSSRSHLEVHYWVRSNGRWLRKSVQAVLLDG